MYSGLFYEETVTLLLMVIFQKVLFDNIIKER